MVCGEGDKMVPTYVIQSEGSEKAGERPTHCQRSYGRNIVTLDFFRNGLAVGRDLEFLILSQTFYNYGITLIVIPKV